jgi:alanine or glycine:cation symporter, AGCS family
MEAANNFILFIDAYLGSAAYFPWLLLGVGFFFTIYLGFPQIRLFKHACDVVRGKYSQKGDLGDISHFQALTTALSGTVGTGNIGGVALAIHLGGPAALFWMWITAFLGMATKFVEVTLSHKYRVVTDKGSIAGGPMYYMERRLNMKWLAIFFAGATVISSFGTGNMPQVNNIAQSVNTTFGVPPVITGSVLAVLLALVIVGGIKRIAQVTEFLVPIMAFVYIIGAFGVIIYCADNIIPSFNRVFSEIFTGSSAVGGFLGASFAYAFNRGVNRGLFSNEAGQGSAPIAHASARASEPVSEGVVSILEPFIDTIIICTLTGLAILSSGVWTEKYDNTFQAADMEFVEGSYHDDRVEDQKSLALYLTDQEGSGVSLYNGVIQIQNGIAASDNFTLIHARSIAEDVKYLADGELYSGPLTIKQGVLDFDSGDGQAAIVIEGKSLIHSAALTTKAFTKSVFGAYGEYIVAIGLTLFAFSTAIAWSYYGDRAITYLFGTGAVLPYRMVYVAGFFLASIMDTRLVWNFSAVAIVVMTIPNLFGITMLHREMKDTFNDYWADVKNKEKS